MFGFMVITGFGFFRECIYEIWLLVHILSAYLGLLLTYTHTHCTTYFVLASLGFIAFDICGRIVLWTTHNVLFFPERHPPKTLGYNAKLQILNNDYVYLSIADVAFRWKAGQHVYITIPHLRKIESHPFTIANLAGNSGPRREMALIIKPRHGFSLDLLRWGLKHSSKSLTVFLNGPYGNPPSLAGYDTVVMIATGNRASFTVPLLQELVCTGLKVPRVSVHMICRTSSDMGWYLSQLQATLKSIPLYSTEFEIQVHITSSTDSDATDIPLDQAQAPYSGAPGTQTHWTDMFNYEKEEIELEPDSHHVYSGERSDKNSRDSSGSISPYPNDAKARDDEEEEEEQLLTEPSATDPTSAELPAQSSVPRTMVLSQGRPSVDAMIRPAVTDARGRVLVVAAVAGRLRSQISTCVSRLNRELVMPGLIGRDGSDTFPLSLELWCEVNGD
jgi:NAD(P)H-flavin reductase